MMMDRARHSFCPRKLAAWLMAAMFISTAAVREVSGQTQQASTPGVQERFLEEQLRPLIVPELRSPEAENRCRYDFGGVLRHTGLWFEDHGPDINSPFIRGGEFQGYLQANDLDLRPWLSVNVDGVHYGFIRGQLDFLQYCSGDSFDRNSDWRGPFVDLGFYRLDIDRALDEYHGWYIDGWSADVTVGRQFLYVGRGIAYSLVADAVSTDWVCGPWAGMAFASQSIRHFDNIDLSVPGFSRSDREFCGAQIEYEGFDHWKPYFYAVVERDRSEESPEDPGQEFDYDSEYYGWGLQGEAMFECREARWGIPNLQYFAEFIVERGDSFGIDATESQDPIRSWAMDVGLVYYGKGSTKPRYLVEFAQATGDSNRSSPQNTAIGNAAGTTDRGFLGFGFLNTGFSFAPLFANLEFARVAASCRPCPETHWWNLKELEIGASCFAFWRPEEDGGISDIRADVSGHHYLGSEVDFYATWRLSTDLYLMTNYGTFFPDTGSFSVERSRQFLSFSLVWLF